jgi:hypothetical protein
MSPNPDAMMVLRDDPLTLWHLETAINQKLNTILI